MSYGADTVAGALLTSLLTGEDITLPEVDLDDPLFVIPGGGDSAIYESVDRITNAELTQQSITGTGAFDVIMGGFRAQLIEEYKANRISGAEYTKAFVSLTESAMSNAVQFLIARDNTFWQSATAQAQAITARVALATAKVQLAIAQAQALNSRAEYGLTKLKLATEDAQYGQIKFQVDNLLPIQEDLATAQLTGQGFQNAAAQFNVENILPLQESQLTAQIALVNEQKEVQRAQTQDDRSDEEPVTGVLGKQKDLYQTQAESYVKDAKLKAVKTITDAYLMVGTSEGYDIPSLPTPLTDSGVEEVLNVLITDYNLNPAP